MDSTRKVPSTTSARNANSHVPRPQLEIDHVAGLEEDDEGDMGAVVPSFDLCLDDDDNFEIRPAAGGIEAPGVAAAAGLAEVAARAAKVGALCLYGASLSLELAAAPAPAPAPLEVRVDEVEISRPPPRASPAWSQTRPQSRRREVIPTAGSTRMPCVSLGEGGGGPWRRRSR